MCSSFELNSKTSDQRNMTSYPELINKFLIEFFFYFFIFFSKNFFHLWEILKKVAENEAQYPTFFSIVSPYLSYLIKRGAGGRLAPTASKSHSKNVCQSGSFKLQQIV